MKNTNDIDGSKAIVSFDPEINLFRGEFIGLNGGADFYAFMVDELRTEAKKSLDVFIEIYREKGIEPRRSY